MVTEDGDHKSARKVFYRSIFFFFDDLEPLQSRALRTHPPIGKPQIHDSNYQNRVSGNCPPFFTKYYLDLSGLAISIKNKVSEIGPR